METKKLNNIILLEKLETNLQDDSTWQHYQVGNNIDSYVLVNNNFVEQDIINKIEGKLPSLIKLNTLSPYMQKIIYECTQTDNEMWFVEDDDNCYIKLLASNSFFEKDLQREVEDKNLNGYIRFNEDGCRITVYGGISEVINYQQ